MRILRSSDPGFEEQLGPLFNRTAFDPEIERGVAEILAQVRARGDEAVCEYALRFDHVHLSPSQFRVSDDELQSADKAVPSSLRKAVRQAHKQIRDFSGQNKPSAWSYSPRNGVVLGERYAPLDRVAVYVPGGTAPLVSTVLHTATMAEVAGVEEIVLVTPPDRQGQVNPAILYAARIAGVTEVYRLGGVYAIGALAFGTDTVRKVEKIVGPGNAYVTSAKRQVYGYVALDLVAGPSEILVIADETADPAHIAADMLSQAEHGSGHEQAVLMTDTPGLTEAVRAQLIEQSRSLSRAECVQKVLDNGVFLIEVDDLDQAAELASRYAPEHLEIMVRGPGRLAKKITAAGAVFLGRYTPEPVGDFVAGPSHVLPTGGAARFFSGLTIDQFYRRMSVVNYQKRAFLDEIPLIEAFAEAEGLDAHGRSAAIRNESGSRSTGS